MQHSLFIPAEKLGELVYNRCDGLALSDDTRKNRQREFTNVLRMLRALHLVLDGQKVLAIGTSLRSDGEKGAVITFENAQVSSAVSE